MKEFIIESKRIDKINGKDLKVGMLVKVKSGILVSKIDKMGIPLDSYERIEGTEVEISDIIHNDNDKVEIGISDEGDDVWYYDSDCFEGIE